MESSGSSDSSSISVERFYELLSHAADATDIMTGIGEDDDRYYESDYVPETPRCEWPGGFRCMVDNMLCRECGNTWDGYAQCPCGMSSDFEINPCEHSVCDLCGVHTDNCLDNNNWRICSYECGSELGMYLAQGETFKPSLCHKWIYHCSRCGVYLKQQVCRDKCAPLLCPSCQS